MGSSLAIGLASPPGAGGLCVALVETDGNRRVETRSRLILPYAAAMQSLLDAAVAAASELERPSADAVIAEADLVFSGLCLSGVETMMRKAFVTRADVDLIGLHGHCLAHRPKRGWSWQLGDAQKLAQLTETDVISSFSDADLSVDGTGEPLAPVFHRALLQAVSFPAALLLLAERPSLIIVDNKGAVSATFLDDAPVTAEQVNSMVPSEAALVVGGEGCDTMIERLQTMRSSPCLKIDHIGLDAPSWEAECAAYLAVRHLAMLPVTFPATTGAPFPVGAGVRFSGRETGFPSTV